MQMATQLPFDYYNVLDEVTDTKLVNFLTICKDERDRILIERMNQLDEKVTREEFDKVFDGHWHAAVLIRHLIYITATGTSDEEAIGRIKKHSPVKRLATTYQKLGDDFTPAKASSRGKDKPKGLLARKLACNSSSEEEDDGDDDDGGDE